MKKRPIKKSKSRTNKKRQLSSDAKIIVALLKKHPQTKQELCEKTKISESTFYRNISLLEKQQIIKCANKTYALSNFDSLEKTVQTTLTKLIAQDNWYIYPHYVADEVGKPWAEIEIVTYKIAKQLGLTITKSDNKIVFLKLK